MVAIGRSGNESSNQPVTLRKLEWPCPSMTLEEARAFVTHIKFELGRWPGFYSGHDMKEALGTLVDPILKNLLVLACAIRPDACRPSMLEQMDDVAIN